MNDLIKEIWAKQINEHFERNTKLLKSLAQERQREELSKMNKRIVEAREQIKEMTAEELAEILVAFENKVDQQETIIKNQKEQIEVLDKIKDLIAEEYGLYEW